MKRLISVFALICCFSGVFAFGKKETEEIVIDEKQSWQEDFDLTEKKEGKYNILVTATDIGGNVAQGGPYNLFIDPDSDLPIAGITNPLSGMVVPGNLNIVGTCIDDDAVEKVEIIIDGDFENPIIAEGKDFWSYYLDTNSMEEGRHTVTVCGIDINGVRGKSKSVAWHLNRRVPDTRVESHSMGMLVSGKQKVTGTITDGNEIMALQFSQDGGKTYEEVSISASKDGIATFNLTIDTLKMEDGPQVCWFKAYDGLGSVGLLSFLFFVDNTNPEVRIISPKDDEYVNGKFSVAGVAKDTIGLKSLKWDFGGLTGDIPIVAGNPYWSVDLDARNLSGSSIDFTLIAEDTVGNISKETQPILVDKNLDMAIVSVVNPLDGSVIFDDFRLKGIAQDDDGVKTVHYKVDGGEEVVLETNGVFIDNISDKIDKKKNGSHTIEIWAMDIDGVEGKHSSVSFVVAGNSPEIKVLGITENNSNDIVKDFMPGLEINPESNSAIKIGVNSDAGLVNLKWQLNDLVEENILIENAKKGQTVFSIPLDKCPWGVVEAKITATDIYERTIKNSVFFYVTNLSKTRGDISSLPPDIVLNDNGAANIYIESVAGQPYLPGMEVVAAPVLSETNDYMVVVIDSPIPLKAATYSVNGGAANSLKIRSLGEGSTQFAVDIPISGMKAELSNIVVNVERNKASNLSVSGNISVLRPKSANGINDEERIYFFDSDLGSKNFYNISKEKTLKAYVNFDDDVEIVFSDAQPNLELQIENKVLSISPKAEGEYKNVTLDIKGNGKVITSSPINIRSDYFKPEIEILEPAENGAWVKKEILLSGFVKESEKISRCDYSVDGGNTWRFLELNKNLEIDGKIPFEQKIDISMCPEGFLFLDILVQDEFGNITVGSKIYNKDTTPPEVSVILPEAGETVNGETKVVLKVKDTGELAKGEYVRSDGGRGLRNMVPPPPLFDENGNEIEIPEEKLPSDEIEVGTTGHFELNMTPLISTMVGSVRKPLESGMIFQFTDGAGNVSYVDTWDFKIDNEMDKPIAEIHVPSENEIITTDFEISGVVYDDDGLAKVCYKIDDGNWIDLKEFGSSFAIPIPLKTLTDNEHTITAYAVDVHGIKGNEVVRKFRVSLEEPKGHVISPTIDNTVKGIAVIKGVASDKNGIDKVQISLDNGNTFNDVIGTENWEYEFDTRIIQDGTHVVFFKIWDKYGIQGLYSTLINIDNTKPEINMDLPLDGSIITGNLFYSGHTSDNINLRKVKLIIRSLDLRQVAVPKHLSEINLEPDDIISGHIDISTLSNGHYNFEIIAEDMGGNETHVSRNIMLDKSMSGTKVDILYPMNGEHVQGMFNLYGQVTTESEVDSLLLYIDGVESGGAMLSSSGFFKFTITPDLLSGGSHNLTVRALVNGKDVVSSSDRYIIYTPAGPWVTIDNFAMGDFAIDRPFIEGSAGYALRESELMKLRSKETSSIEKKELKAKSVEKIELSFDNGKTFEEVSTNKKWRYRFENGDKAQGYYFMIVRATMKNGETAITKSIIQVDKTSPTVRLISPGEGGRFNEALKVSGLAADDIGLKDVKLSLRSGDKSSYAIPAFIQGLYFDWHFWGATLYDIGAGLTFFDDNVKLQVQFGQYTQQQYNLMQDVFHFEPTKMRYGGNVVGLKLLANIGFVPFSHFFGPNWEWLSANFAIGANFSRFSESQSGEPQILSALVAQLEFPRITIPKQEYFRTMSFYTEFQLWFIPTDVDSIVEIEKLVPQISGGIRVNVF